MDPVINFASFTFMLSIFILIHDYVFFVALGAWCLELEACGLSLSEIFHSCARTPGSGPGGRV